MANVCGLTYVMNVCGLTYAVDISGLRYDDIDEIEHDVDLLQDFNTHQRWREIT